MKPIRGVIFDLFHTLTARESEWSDEPPTCDLLGFERRAWDRVLTESSRWRLAGEERDPHSILTRLARQLNPEIADDVVRRALDTRIRRFDQVFQRIPQENIEVLRRLRAAGYKLALLSNADAMEAGCYSRGQLKGLFDVEIFSCDAGCAKPEPEIYRACLHALGLAADECIFVGDGGSDELQGARAVGLRTVFVSGVIEELFPERVESRRALADHHVRWAHEVERVLCS
jgi:putative hydrolase of the HAD superfamily